MKKMINKIEKELETLVAIQDNLINRYDSIFIEDDCSIEVENELSLLNEMMQYVTNRYDAMIETYHNIRCSYNYMRTPDKKEYRFYRW